MPGEVVDASICNMHDIRKLLVYQYSIYTGSRLPNTEICTVAMRREEEPTIWAIIEYLVVCGATR